MKIRPEVTPFILITLIVGVILVAIIRFKGAGWLPAVIPSAVIMFIFSGYFFYFFRDPVRTAPSDPNMIVAGAEGVVAAVTEMKESKHLNTDTVRISIFLSLFNVHVNRSPIAGQSRFLGYVPGKHYFTFKEKSSEHNQHNAILITGEKTSCLVYQIVGPVCRRVVYFLDPDSDVDVKAGDRIGMMKFGSRLDMYLPAKDVRILVKPGDKVRAGETVVAELVGE